MDFDSSSLSLDCLILIFSFLEEDDLMRASGVCKRWTFCNVTRSECGKGSWKTYYLQRSRLEHKMETGRSGADYTCRSLRGHTGSVVGLVYLVGRADVSASQSVVCSASTDGTVRAWDVQQGAQLWASPAGSPLCEITVDPTLGTLFTSNSVGTVAAWDGLSGQEVASFATSSSGCSLLAYTAEGRSVVLAGTSGGALYTLTSPSLSQLSRHVVFDALKIDLLISSADRKWLFAGTQESSDTSPKVFFSECLSSSSEEDPPLWQSLPVSSCSAAAFLPSESARLVLVHNTEGNWGNYTLSVFSITMKKSKYKADILVQQVETFQLAVDGGHPDVLLHTQGNDTVMVATGNKLRVYTLKGVLLASFEDHMQPIIALCVDNFRVVTASRDLSLRVLTWKKERNGRRTLQSKFHLLGGSHTMSRGFTKVACDYVSIVASVQSVNGKDVLKAYSFNS